MAEGIGFGIDQGFTQNFQNRADVAGQRADVATQQAAQFNPLNGIGQGIGAVSSALGKQEQAQAVDTSYNGLIRLVEEGLQGKWINDSQASSVLNFGKQDPEKGIEAYLQLAVPARAESAANRWWVDMGGQTSIEDAIKTAQAQTMAAMENRKAKRAGGSNGTPDQIGYTAAGQAVMMPGQKATGAVPFTDQFPIETIDSARRAAYADIERKISSPEGRASAKKKVDEYLAKVQLPTVQERDAGLGTMEKVQLMSRYNKLLSEITGQVNKARSDSALKPQLAVIQNLGETIDQMNKADSKALVEGLNPMNIWAGIAGVPLQRRPSPEAQAVTQQFIQFLNTYIKDMSGAAVSNQEAKRLFEGFGIPSKGLFEDERGTTLFQEVYRQLKTSLQMNHNTARNTDPSRVITALNSMYATATGRVKENAAAKGYAIDQGMIDELQSLSEFMTSHGMELPSRNRVQAKDGAYRTFYTAAGFGSTGKGGDWNRSLRDPGYASAQNPADVDQQARDINAAAQGAAKALGPLFLGTESGSAQNHVAPPPITKPAL